MADIQDITGRWYDSEGDDVGKIVYDLGTQLESDQEWRKNIHERMTRMYKGDDVNRTDVASTYAAPDLNYNVSRAASDTVQAEISGRQKPTGKFQTNGADWKTKRKAKKMEKYCNAVKQLPQGRYLNTWELFEDCFLDSAIGGMGVAKVFNRNGRINIERHLSHELFVDPNESKYGDPQNLFHVYTMEADKAIQAFARDPDLDISDERRDEVEQAIGMTEEAEEVKPGASPRIVKTIKIVEAWRLPVSKDKPGRHVFAIQSTTLHDEEWDRPSFPFVIQRWEAEREGWYAKGLIEQGMSIALEIDANASKLQERFKLCGAKRTYYEINSIAPEHLAANDAEVMIPVKPGAMIPKENPPKPISESEWAWLESQQRVYFELLGVSQMRASAKKDPGITAAVAIRQMNDMQSQRFALKAKGYENAYVSLDHQILWCAREAHDAGDKVIARFNEEIDWGSIDLPEDPFEITIAPTSSLPNDPAGRMQMTQELFSQGIIGPDTYKQLLGWPDLEKEMDMQTSFLNWLDQRIDTMLDAEGEEELAEAYEPPDGMIMDKPRALLHTARAYFEALYDHAPEENLALLRNYIQDLDEQIQASEQAAAKAAADLAMAVQSEAEKVPGGGGAPAPGGGPPMPPPGG